MADVVKRIHLWNRDNFPFIPIGNHCKVCIALSWLQFRRAELFWESLAIIEKDKGKIRILFLSDKKLSQEIYLDLFLHILNFPQIPKNLYKTKQKSKKKNLRKLKFEL